MRPIVNVLEEDRATDIGNMHKQFGKDLRVVPEISSRTDTQTDRQTYSSQYFATASAGEVTLETRHRVEGSFGNEFPSIYNHCGVMAA